MSVQKRGSKYHYRFSVNKKSYSGVCAGCETKKEAEDYEKKIRSELDHIRHHTTVASLVTSYRYELSGATPVTIEEAFDLQLKKPTRKPLRPAYIRIRRAFWNDFRLYMAEKHADCLDLADIKKTHCEAYLKYLLDNGRFNRQVTYTRGGQEVSFTQKDYALAPKTIREIARTCQWVISRLAEDAGISRNPWDGVILPDADSVEREIFTEEELALIREGIKSDPFCEPLFSVTAVTGLTEGDVCTLRWDEIHWKDRVIRRKRRKTGARLEIPILPHLAEYLRSIPRRGEYVFPEHAEMYLTAPTGVSYRVQKFLNTIGIETTRKREGMRAVSIKDLHSMRHVFCFYAGAAGIPLPIVQSIVGHLTPEMTRHYMRHTNTQTSLREIERLPMFLRLGDNAVVPDDEQARKDLADLAYSLPISEVKRLLGVIRTCGQAAC